MVWREKQKVNGFFRGFLLLCWVLAGETAADGARQQQNHRNAYATMMYMGTPRDYEFFVATRVMIRSLARLDVDADLVVIASLDVPPRWVHTLEQEDGAKVVRVQNLNNPYKNQRNFDRRFKLTLNKLYAWSLVDYDRVVMLDADNLFLRKVDELFQCGQFCAVFINPCIFHTGLFVLQEAINPLFGIMELRTWKWNWMEMRASSYNFIDEKTTIPPNSISKPSMVVFKDMLHELDIGRNNPDGADQGFIGGYFPDLLDQPMFHPPANNTKLDGQYRLPLGYQMDASYYYLKLRWSVPCGPNSVITFPGAAWLKPWYWWSWPVLPLGISWHEQRRQTLGYGAEMPMVLIQAVIFLGIIVLTRLARPNVTKLCYRHVDKNISLIQTSFKIMAMWSIFAAYIVPFFLIPRTLHPLIGWSLYLLGSFALLSIAINAFLLPMLAVLALWLGMFGSLLVMAFPWYPDGVVRALAVFGYAFCCAPIVWVSVVKVVTSLQVSLEREAFFPRLCESSTPPGFNKLY